MYYNKKYTYNKNSLSIKYCIASFEGSLESCSLSKLIKVHLVYNSRSDGVYTTSLAIASKRALINGPESSRQDSIGCRLVDNNASAAFCSLGSQISILSPMNVQTMLH